MKIKVNEKIIDVPNYFQVIGNKLYNGNTKKYEGVDGDVVTVIQHGTSMRGHVKGHTESQIVPTYEWQIINVSAQGLQEGSCKIKFMHNTPVYEVDS